ncbi:hypothetical protein G7Y89_g12982 [Cudoniella acicularis]|uniref:High affinity methionine permease n=1 Tax=Cudoniella acicularis TaxID=354080 RepID=A0A8H4R7R9_9HELO|nr:hypothetical protein G7Y89_g12982 [Cudoniella acicularis]
MGSSTIKAWEVGSLNLPQERCSSSFEQAKDVWRLTADRLWRGELLGRSADDARDHQRHLTLHVPGTVEALTTTLAGTVDLPRNPAYRYLLATVATGQLRRCGPSRRSDSSQHWLHRGEKLEKAGKRMMMDSWRDEKDQSCRYRYQHHTPHTPRGSGRWAVSHGLGLRLMYRLRDEEIDSTAHRLTSNCTWASPYFNLDVISTHCCCFPTTTKARIIYFFPPKHHTDVAVFSYEAMSRADRFTTSMAIISRLRSFFTTSEKTNIVSPNGRQLEEAKNESSSDNDNSAEPRADQIVEPGELTFEEDTGGGMGRHLGIGRIIGTGIFSTPSSITSSVGSVGAALLLWTLGALLSFCGLFVWLEFGCMFPRSGGEKVYLEAVYRKPKFLAAVVFSTQAIMLGFTAQGCIVFASNILVAAGHTATAWNSRGIAIAVITFVTVIHTFMPKTGVRLMDTLSSIKILLLLFIVITGFVVLGGGVKSVPDPHASFRNAFAGSVHSSGPYATALFKVINSYSGWNNAAYVLNEVKHPVRTLKIAGPLGLGTCALLFLLANVAYFAAATPHEIATSGTTVASYFIGKVFGHTAKRVISVFIALSALGNVLTVTFAQARVNQELAKEGVIPFGRFWASTWPKGAPGAGLLLHFIPSFIVIVAIPADVEGYPLSIINLFVVLGLLILRHTSPSLPRPFRVPLILPLVFLAAQCFLLIDPFIRPPGGKGDTSLPYWLYPIVGIAVLLLGVGYWFVWRVLWPKLGGFKWVEKKSELEDGTIVAHFVKAKEE